MKSIELNKKDIEEIIQETNDILRDSLKFKNGRASGWRNGRIDKRNNLEAQEKEYKEKKEEAGAIATALALWYCRETKSDFYVKDANESKIHIASCYGALVDTINDQAIEVTETKLESKQLVYWKSKSTDSGPSFEATSTVISALNHGGLIKLSEDIYPKIKGAGEWLLKEYENPEPSPARPTTPNDSLRVFVTCNYLHALISLKKIPLKKAIDWAFNLEHEQLGKSFWCEEGEASVTIYSDAILYKTVKILNLLNLCRMEAKIGNMETELRRIEDACERGREYIREVIERDKIELFYREPCTEVSGKPTKPYYHNTFAEIIELMLNTRNKWSPYDICKILKLYLMHYKEHGREPWRKEDGRGHKIIQMFLLIPTAKQIHDLIKYLPSFENKLIVYESGIIVVDFEKKQLEYNDKGIAKIASLDSKALIINDKDKNVISIETSPKAIIIDDTHILGEIVYSKYINNIFESKPCSKMLIVNGKLVELIDVVPKAIFIDNKLIAMENHKSIRSKERTQYSFVLLKRGFIVIVVVIVLFIIWGLYLIHIEHEQTALIGILIGIGISILLSAFFPIKTFINKKIAKTTDEINNLLK